MAEEIQIETIIECFSELSDPRIDRRKFHKLLDVVVIGLCTVISGGEGFTDMEAYGKAKKEWLKTFLELEHGIPSHDTFGRVFAVLDPQEFEQCLLSWVKRCVNLPKGEIVPIDGKTLCGSHDRANEQAQIELVSAWARSQGVTLGQVKVSEDSNEMTAVPAILRALNVEDCVVTVDALNCQKKIVWQIREQKADYVCALKGNHAHLLEEVAEFLASVREDRTVGFAFATCQSVEKDHGRIETRRYWQAEAPDWLSEFGQWRDLKSVGLVEATREIGEQMTTETRYYLSSLPVEVDRFALAVRGHWSIENSCHWVLDVVFGEDNSRVRVGNAAENLAVLRRLALNLLKTEKTAKLGVRAKRLKAAWDNNYLLKILRD
jgi:predicted transposase YbfD/YdcC